jgi:hypothetical protein
MQLEQGTRAPILPLEEIKESTQESLSSLNSPVVPKSVNMRRKCIEEWGEATFNQVYNFYRHHADIGTNPLELKQLAIQ